MAKEFKYKGKTVSELSNMTYDEFLAILPSRQRRSLIRLKPEWKKVMDAIEASNEKKPIRTHVRELIVTPKMVGKVVMVYNGKEFVRLNIEPEMISHRLGEYSLTRRRVQHSDPGIGATRSSKFISLR